jgi:hypothetical protein
MAFLVWYGWRTLVGFSSLPLGNENRELKIGKERHGLRFYSRFDETFVTNKLDLNQVF